MKHISITIFLLLNIFLATGCQDGSNRPDGITDTSNTPEPPVPQLSGLYTIFPDLDGSTYYTSNNNTARLTGPVIGNGSVELSDWHKPVSVSLVNNNPNYEFGSAYASNHVFNDGRGHWIVQIKNASSITRCQIRIDGIDYLDASGNVFRTDSLGYVFVKGSTYLMGVAQHTDTCLAAGETGYILSIELAIFPQIESIRLDTISDYIQEGLITITEPLGRAIPISYSTSNDGSSITVTVNNSGTEAVRYSSQFSRYVLLDADGVPLDWGVFAPVDPVEVPPSGSVDMVIRGLFSGYPLFVSAANIIRPIIDFGSVPTVTTNTLASNDNVKNNSDLHKFREKQIRTATVP